MSGYVLLLLVGIFWAAASLVLAGKRGELGAVAAGTIRAPAGAIALLGFVAATQRAELAAPFRDRRHLWAIVLAGLIGTGIGSMLYVYSVVEAGAGRAAVLSATAPLMGLPLSILILKEAQRQSWPRHPPLRQRHRPRRGVATAGAATRRLNIGRRIRNSRGRRTYGGRTRVAPA
jgi:uncharacterized membrane protein